jgi:hypothetical protein
VSEHRYGNHSDRRRRQRQTRNKQRADKFRSRNSDGDGWASEKTDDERGTGDPPDPQQHPNDDRRTE